MQVRMRDKSGVRLYRFVVEDVDRHDNVRIYFRKKGQPKIRLVERPGTASFDQEYQKALAGELIAQSGEPNAQGAKGPSAAVPGTMRWLCQQYYASAKFALGPSTRQVRRSILEQICRRTGNFPFATMEPRDVAKLRDERAVLPGSANNLVKALRQLFAWASSPEYGYASKNPARGVAYLKPTKADGFKAWTEADVAKYEAWHPIGSKARLALDLFLYTGVRRSDVVKLGPQMERDGKLCFTETKGRGQIVKTHELPILPPHYAAVSTRPLPGTSSIW
jgi:hypothetical protein